LFQNAPDRQPFGIPLPASEKIPKAVGQYGKTVGFFPDHRQVLPERFGERPFKGSALNLDYSKRIFYFMSQGSGGFSELYKICVFLLAFPIPGKAPGIPVKQGNRYQKCGKKA